MSTGLLDQPPVISAAVAIGDTSAILPAILDPAVQLALWRRTHADAPDWLDARYSQA